MAANFDRALDAKYAMAQVGRLAGDFGGSFTSSDLVFGGGGEKPSRLGKLPLARHNSEIRFRAMWETG